MREARVVGTREHQASQSELLYIPKPLKYRAVDDIGFNFADADCPVNRVCYAPIVERPDRNTPTASYCA